MAAKKVSWDIAELESQYSLIDRYLGDIKAELDEEKSLRETVATSFQTPAGELYLQHLTGNVDTLIQLVEEVETLMQDLRKVISNHYEPCEREVSTKVQNLISSLQ